MPAERWAEVMAALGEGVPVFVLALVSLAALLGLLIFGPSGLGRRLQARSRRTLERMHRRDSGLASIADPAEAMPTTPGVVGATQRLAFWLRSRGGLPMFVLGGAVVGLGLFGALAFAGLPVALAALPGVLVGLAVPWWLNRHLKRRRMRKIASEFPAAVDTMVRGLRAGLPLIDCVRLIANEAEPGIAAEFRRTLADYDIGVPVEQSLQRTAERLPLEEVRFFAVVVALQSQTGGRLAEMLETLSDALRNRRALKDKVQIMSQEAKSSAMIIGALPVVVAGALFLVSPDYVGILLSSTAGLLALTASGLWMLLGIQVMRGMIHFDV